MRYFGTVSENSFILFEADDDLTQYRIIEHRGILNERELKPFDLKDEESMPRSGWCPISNKDYFVATRDELDAGEALLHMMLDHL